MERYEPLDVVAPLGWQRYKSKGVINGIFVSRELLDHLGDGEEITFVPSWGGFMIATLGDVLAINPFTKDLYRIAREEFNKTYKVMGD